MTDHGFPAEEIDTSRPHPARMYDYYLDGWDNYEVDREAAERVIEVIPEIRPAARANRAFLQRAVRMVTESGIRQIIDIGTGIPTSPNVHEVAQSIAPDVRVAYIDNDPIVTAHAGARLAGNGNTSYVLADLRDPKAILEHPEVRKQIDFDRPVALLLVAILHFIADEENPAEIVRTLADALPQGSYLVLSHATADFHAKDAAAIAAPYKNASATLTLRAHAEILGYFDGFELLDPGLVQLPLWRPDGPAWPAEEVARIGLYCGVGHKG